MTLCYKFIKWGLRILPCPFHLGTIGMGTNDVNLDENLDG